MKKIKVTVKSACPMLMNRFAIEEQKEDTEAKRKDRKYDSTEDAKKASYYDETGFYIPSSHFEGALKKAGTEFKAKGQKTYKETILSAVFVDEEKVYLNKNGSSSALKEWDEIDRQAVKVQTARIVRSRPKFNSWEATFTLSYNDQRIHQDVLKQILEEAGLTKGVGDYRPKYGRFNVVKFDLIN